jgi:hypothetical protein
MKNSLEIQLEVLELIKNQSYAFACKDIVISTSLYRKKKQLLKEYYGFNRELKKEEVRHLQVLMFRMN